MNEWVSKEACPRCRKMGQDRSGDNLGVHEDGHKYCFACHYYVPASGFDNGKIKDRIVHTAEDKRIDSVKLPPDFGFSIPDEPCQWLDKYALTEDEIYDNSIGWSPSRQYLIFPVFGINNQLLLWQGRNFGKNRDKKKYHTEGNTEELFHILPRDFGLTVPRLVLVEDMVSAIKVSRVCPAMPLFGSNISMDRIVRLRPFVTNLVIWLDSDKGKYAMDVSEKARPFFESIQTIHTVNDPKDFMIHGIREKLYG